MRLKQRRRLTPAEARAFRMTRKVNLWSDCLPASVDAGRTRDFLRGFGFDAQPRGELFGETRDAEYLRRMASFLAGIRIRDFDAPLERPPVPSPAQEREEISVMRTGRADPSAAYDGFWFQRKLHGELAAFSGPGAAANLVLTGRLVCTYEGGRHHARTVVMSAAKGAAQVVSSAGAETGPAKPPEYHWAKGRIFQSGSALDREEALSVLDEMFEGGFVKQSDPVMGRVVSAFALQPLFYAAFGKRFCENRDCCLFNSHLQSDVLRAQAKMPVCGECMKLLGSPE